MSRPHILHLHSSFSLGGKEWRAVRLMNAFGDAARHTIVSGVPEAVDAQNAIAPGIAYEIAQDPPSLTGQPSVARFEAIARFMRRFDLVLTYNWGAIDGVMARRAFPKGAPPLVHHEDGFNADEADGLMIRRNVYRRIALPAAHALAVPSDVLGQIALKTWKQPVGKVFQIANGIRTDLYARPPAPDAIPGFRKREGEVVIGALAGLREVKDLPALVRACGGLSGKFRLVIVGEGPERGAIQAAAETMGIEDRVHLPGFLPEPHRYVGLFDLLAVSSRSEQFPVSVIEAMAAGLPVASLPVGDVASMVAEENRPFVAPYMSEVSLRDMIQGLMRDPELRRSAGAANRAKAQVEYDEAGMVARYRGLYGEALGNVRAFG